MAQYSLIVLLGMFVLNRAEELDKLTKATVLQEIILPGSLVILTLGTTAGLFERRTWAFSLEIVRLIALASGAAAYAVESAYLPSGLAVAVIGLSGSLLWLARYRRLFGAKPQSVATEVVVGL